MKHVGKMKNNNAKIVVVYRTLPGDSASALVVGTNALNDTYHDSLMSLIQDVSAQQANELADILSVRKFPDGSNMLSWLHNNGHLKKVSTKGVIMTPTTQDTLPLDELNQLIADQKGVTVDDLAVTDGVNANEKPKAKPAVVEPIVETPVAEPELTPAQLRSKADELVKQAQQLRKKADGIDPPKSRTKKVPVAAE